jgi:predicted PurR-regulated permease PerM
MTAPAARLAGPRGATPARPRRFAQVSADHDLRGFAIRTAVVGAMALLVLAVWQAIGALLLGFAAVLIAILLARAAAALGRGLRLGYRPALAVVLVVLVLALAGGATLLGSRIQAQLGEVTRYLQQGLRALPVDGDTVIQNATSWATQLTQLAAGAVQGATYGALVLITAVYLAAEPQRYRDGALLLVPPAQRARARDLLDRTGEALWRWLVGTGLSMLAVGILTAGGLLLLDVPAAVALGIIAGLMEAIPLLGPWVAAVPGVLVGLASGGWSDAAWIALFYLAVQQIEGNLLVPLIQQRAVDLPPALTVLGVLAFGALFGIAGILLATPLLVVTIVAVRTFYVDQMPPSGLRKSAGSPSG